MSQPQQYAANPFHAALSRTTSKKRVRSVTISATPTNGIKIAAAKKTAPAAISARRELIYQRHRIFLHHSPPRYYLRVYLHAIAIATRVKRAERGIKIARVTRSRVRCGSRLLIDRARRGEELILMRIANVFVRF